MNERNTIKSILNNLSKEMPIVSQDDIVETIKTLYPSCDIPRDEKNIIVDGMTMTIPFCSSKETKRMLIKENSPLLRIYKDLDRGDILLVDNDAPNNIKVTNLSIKEEYRHPFTIEKLDVIKGNFNIIKRKSIDLIKTLERLETD